MYYMATVKTEKMNDKGNPIFKKEKFLVRAYGLTDLETSLTKELMVNPEYNGFSITSATEYPLGGIIRDDKLTEYDFYEVVVKVDIGTLEKPKFDSEKYIIESTDGELAIKKTKEHYKESATDWYIFSHKKTPIVDLIENNTINTREEMNIEEVG